MKLCHSAWAAGQKKKISTIAICGAISTQGSQRCLKRTRFSIDTGVWAAGTPMRADGLSDD
jgi:hypothetical protein